MATLEKKRIMRFYVVIVAIIFLFVVAGVRLFDIQVVDGEKYATRAVQQQNSEIILPATRGIIYDKNSTPIVSNTMFVSFAADPKITKPNAKKFSNIFGKVFDKPSQQYLAKLKSKKRFVWLERSVHPDIAKKIDIKSLDGIIAINEPRRLYHLEEIGGQLVGAINIEQKGIAGIEYRYDEMLRGQNGKLIMERDALGNQRPSVDFPKINPIDGNSVYLTIDQEYQTIAFDEIRRGVEKMKADAGHVVLLNPKSGAVLAMVNYPSLFPSRAVSSQNEQYKIYAIADMFEPGSVFKIVTAAAAIEKKSIQSTQKFFAENGEWKIKLSSDKIRTIKDSHPHGELTFQEAMETSSNIVMAKLSNIIGADDFYLTARNFGFGMSTGIDLPGESGGELKKPFQWSSTTLNTMSFGYEVGATPLQITLAYLVIANDGILMKPYLIEKIVDSNGEVIEENSPEKIRRVISEKTSRILKNMFVGVVERGTGSEAKIIGVSIAGKTGTSKKFVDGKYQDGIYNASFVGFYPADEPEIVCLVIIENPRVGSYYGGQASAPIFRAIAERIVNNKGLLTKILATENNLLAEEKNNFVPEISNTHIESAKIILEKRGMKYKIVGKGSLVVEQFPIAGTEYNDKIEINLITEEIENNIKSETANVRGMTLRRAINRLSKSNFEIVVNGSGIVVDQIESASTSSKKKITLICASKLATLGVGQ
ncbi:MAG: penicillin-binding transpeptidase domain-containing protein [Bacteroidota bacterium]